MHDVDASLKGLCQRRHRFADEQRRFDARGQDRFGEGGVIGGGIVAKFAHLPQHCDVPAGLFGQHRQRRAHRGGVGVVAFVDDQHLALTDARRDAEAAPGEAAHFGERETRTGEVGAGSIDRRQHGQRVRHPVHARLRQGERQFAGADLRGDKRPARGQTHRLDRMDVGALGQTEGDGARGIGGGGRHQPVAVRAVIGDDGDAAGRSIRRFETLEDFALGVGDGAFVGEEFGVGRRDGGDDRDVRPHQACKLGQLAGEVHAHFEHADLRVARHAGEAERHAGVVVVALDRAMHRAGQRAVERGEQSLLGAGLPHRAGDADHRTAHAGAGGTAEVVQGREGIIDADVRMGRVGGYDRAGGPLREGLIEEAMAIGAVAGERNEQVAGTDLTAVERDAGDGEVGRGGAGCGSGEFGGGPEHQILSKRAWGGGPAKLVEGRRA